VPGPTPSRSRFAHLPRFFVRLAILLLPILFVTILTVALLRHHSARQSEMPVSSLATNWQGALDLSAMSRTQRPVFPYSVVPGGVRDAHELQSAVTRDSVVAKHYSDFHVASARVVRFNRPLEMYVSYRRNNQVYWTKNRMVIPAGETLLSDGDNLARVRCGNRLSAIAAKPVAVTDPSKEELETPEFLPPLLAQLLPGEGVNFIPGEAGGPSGPGPHTGSLMPPPPPGVPPIFPSNSTPLIPVLPPPPPISTPEPGTLILLSLGSALICLFVGLTLRRNSSA
jgi:hypothetical protein